MNHELIVQFDKEIEDKRILITGGTGSFGQHIIDALLQHHTREIVVFSRDEDKHYRLRMRYQNPKLRFMIGDVRDLERVMEACHGINIIYHAAALKHVPYCEFHPYEAVKTNIIGAANVKRAAIANHVQKVIGISTDKAVKPVNTMGMSKALQEKIFISGGDVSENTKFAMVRYGNVVGSRGSVIPLFDEKLKSGEPLPITHREMTRFWLTLEQAIVLVFYATVNMRGGEIFVPKLPACRIVDLAEIMSQAVTGRQDYPIVEIGIRPGEKINEVLISEEEMLRVQDLGEYAVILPYVRFLDPSLTTLHTPLKDGDSLPVKEFCSAEVRHLTKEKIYSLLKSAGWV